MKKDKKPKKDRIDQIIEKFKKQGVKIDRAVRFVVPKEG